jgi:hypothetical protein
MKELYDELKSRLEYLQSLEQTPESRYRILECTLTMVRVQQYLLNSRLEKIKNET